jgi:hypothetical protein
MDAIRPKAQAASARGRRSHRKPGKEGDTKDHRTDILGSGRLEEVGATGVAQ